MHFDESFIYSYKEVKKYKVEVYICLANALKINGPDGNLLVRDCLCVCALAVCFSWYFERSAASLLVSAGEILSHVTHCVRHSRSPNLISLMMGLH